MTSTQTLDDEDLHDDFEAAVPRAVRSVIVSLAIGLSFRAVKRGFTEVNQWRSHLMTSSGRPSAEHRFRQVGHRVSRGKDGRRCGMRELLRDKPLLTGLVVGDRRASLAGDRADLELATQQQMSDHAYICERPADSGGWDLSRAEFDECALCRCIAAHAPDPPEQPILLDFAVSRDLLATWINATGQLSNSAPNS